MLRTKCIKAPREPSDGIRISIMSRHTLNDGLSPDPEITKDLFDEWLCEFAPQSKLIGAYYKRGLSWDEFEAGYIRYLATIKPLLWDLITRAKGEDISLLCIEETPANCHRRLLAETCKQFDPKLEVVIA